jgi:hypothetical protein
VAVRLTTALALLALALQHHVGAGFLRRVGDDLDLPRALELAAQLQPQAGAGRQRQVDAVKAERGRLAQRKPQPARASGAASSRAALRHGVNRP